MMSIVAIIGVVICFISLFSLAGKVKSYRDRLVKIERYAFNVVADGDDKKGVK